jgi:hypothetical protein
VLHCLAQTACSLAAQQLQRWRGCYVRSFSCIVVPGDRAALQWTCVSSDTLHLQVCTGNMTSTQGHTLKPWKNMEALQVCCSTRSMQAFTSLMLAELFDWRTQMLMCTWLSPSEPL